jgi:hypothetical protein
VVAINRLNSPVGAQPGEMDLVILTSPSLVDGNMKAIQAFVLLLHKIVADGHLSF